MNASRCVFFAILFVVLAAQVCRADEAPEFGFESAIETDSQVAEDLFAVPFRSDVYAVTRDGFPDVRILDASDKLVPFLIRRVTEVRTIVVRKSWKAVNPSLQPLETDGLEIRITLKPEDPQPTGMQFVTPLVNFEQEIRVYATIDGKESTLVDGTFIFDYSRFMDVRRAEVTFPATAAREFRIVIAALTADQESQLKELTRSIRGDAEDSRTETTTVERRPFRIDRIELWTEQAEQNQIVDLIHPWPVSDLKVSQDEEHKQTVAEFRTEREPLTSLTLLTSSRNFSRRASVQIPSMDEKNDNWQTIAEGTISNFQLRNLQEDHLTIGMPETRNEHFRVVIDNGDSPELVIDGIEAAGHQYEVVFLKTPDANCRMHYGSPTANSPSHDTAAISTALAQDIRPVAATLGSRAALEKSTRPKPANFTNLLNNPFVLGGVVTVLVVVLGWGLYQASRRIDRMPPEDSA